MNSLDRNRYPGAKKISLGKLIYYNKNETQEVDCKN